MSDRFRKIKLLGKGGFGRVYQAIDLYSGETVALKEMFGEYENWEQCCNLTEVRALQVLNHPHIVALKEVFLSQRKLYLVYELLERDLYQMIEERRDRLKKPISEDHIKRIIYQVLKGVGYIHKRGFFHRDLKPENLVLVGDDLVKITDFGIIKEQAATKYLPCTEYIATRWYRAPEVVLRSK